MIYSLAAAAAAKSLQSYLTLCDPIDGSPPGSPVPGGIQIAGRNINNLRYAADTTLMAESEEELKSLLMKVKEESEKAGLKLNIQNKNIMLCGSIT